MSNENQYDDGYKQGLIDSASRRHSYSYYGKKEIKPIDAYSQGKEDAERHKSRDETKSELIKDEGYRNFLMSVAEIHDSTDVSKVSEVLSVSWRTGGMCGGSCWGDSADRAVTADDPEELVELDKILEKVAPNISFLKYKNLCSEIVHSASYTQNEYYGNYYTYAVHYVLLSELYSALKDRGMI